MKVPVVIIGGFLGAGKTTLVNRLLTRSRQRIAVIVNDFGAINIDQKLIASQDGNMFALTNGCVCCSLGPDFTSTLDEVLALTPSPQRIIVEASGVSDPWRIAQLVKLERGAELEAVIVLADAVNFSSDMADRWLSDTLSRQLLRADLIVLTKCDQADGAAKSKTRAGIEAIRGDVPIIEIANGDLPDVIINPITSKRAGPMFAAEMAHPFRTWQWHPERPLDEARFRNVIEWLPRSVLRAKGFFRLGEEAGQAVFQLVGRRWSLERRPMPVEADELVVIGTKELPVPEELKALFETSLIAI